MVIGLLIIGAIPTVTGVAEAISAKKQQNEKQKESIKFEVTAETEIDGQKADTVVVLEGGKLWLNHPAAPSSGHPFSGYYFAYPPLEPTEPPDPPLQGLVSFVSTDPPALNWVFVDADSRAVRHAGRKDTAGHVVGPWGWNAENDTELTLRDSAEGFVAVREPAFDGRWALYWDPDGVLRAQVADERGSDGWRAIGLTRKVDLGVESKMVGGK